MSPENQSPDQKAEFEEHYEINPGDIVVVSRNLKNPDGTPRLGEDGKQMTELEDGWEVVNLNATNPNNGREGIMLRNTDNPDEFKFYSDRQIREIQKRHEDDIMNRASRAASGMLGETVLAEHPHVEPQAPEMVEPAPDAQAERHEALLEEVSGDMGREATEEVVEKPEETETVEASTALSDTEKQTLVSSALYEFSRRESYSAEEVQTGLNKMFRTFEENERTPQSAINQLGSLGDIKRQLTRAVESYDESMRQLGGRANPDYNPGMVLYRQVEQYANLIHGTKSALSNASENGVHDIVRAEGRTSDTLGEVSHEIDKDEDNVANYLSELSQQHSIEVPEAPKSIELREFVGSVDVALRSVHEAASTLGDSIGETEDAVFKLAREMQQFMGNVQHGYVDRESLHRIELGLDSVSGDERMQRLLAQSRTLSAAMGSVPKRVPELPRR